MVQEIALARQTDLASVLVTVKIKLFHHYYFKTNLAETLAAKERSKNVRKQLLLS